MLITIRKITNSHNLQLLGRSIVPEEWGEDNELKAYDETSLKEMMSNPDYVLLIAYDEEMPVGVAIATKLLKPDGEHWLYVDELGVKPSHRKRGIGRSLMEKLLAIAKEWNLHEPWLGTEPDNDAANHLYQSLNPSETETFVGYTYKINPKNDV